MVASLKPKGRMAMVLDTGAVTRGSGMLGANRERAIRRSFVEADLIEAVFELPDNMFYNTPAQGIVMILNRSKTHPREVLLVNGSTLFTKGRPKNEMLDEHITSVHDAFTSWGFDGASRPSRRSMRLQPVTTTSSQAATPLLLRSTMCCH